MGVFVEGGDCGMAGQDIGGTHLESDISSDDIYFNKKKKKNQKEIYYSTWRISLIFSRKKNVVGGL